MTTAANAGQPSFGLLFILALIVSIGAAALAAPFAAIAVAALGFHFPFPRIFDRTVMFSAAITLVIFAGPMRLPELLREGFIAPRRHLRQFIGGLLAAALIMVALFLAVGWIRAAALPIGPIAGRALFFVAPALLIGVIEEAFFRAILLGGLARRAGRLRALLISSAVYAVAHIVRSPHRYYLTTLHPLAGFENVGAGFDRLIDPGAAVLMLLGLFLLGIALGEAYVLTGRVYASIGLHAGFVIGAKCWPVVAAPGAHLPGWIAGPGPIPLIGAPAAWCAALLLILLMPLVWSAPKASGQPQLRYTS